jgi:hypothetical protein
MIAHTFTCPQGLYFNSITDGCDFRRNVDCEGKDDTEDKKSKKGKFTTTESSIAFDEDENGEEQTVEEILEKIKNAGGLEAFEENLRREEEEKEAIKRKEEERRLEISTKTRNNLSRLLDRKRAEVKDELRRPSLNDDKKNLKEDEEEDTGTKSRGSSRSQLFRNRTRFNLNRSATSTTETSIIFFCESFNSPNILNAFSSSFILIASVLLKTSFTIDAASKLFNFKKEDN